jgi:hypothetical protein
MMCTSPVGKFSGDLFGELMGAHLDASYRRDGREKRGLRWIKRRETPKVFELSEPLRNQHSAGKNKIRTHSSFY